MEVNDAMTNKQVLLIQLYQEQRQLWEAALNSQHILTLTEMPGADIVLWLEQTFKLGQALPDLLIVDIGITKTGSNVLQASSICRWCAANHSLTKVILTNPRRTEIGSLELRWAEKQGAIALLPKLNNDNLKQLLSHVVFDTLKLEFNSDRLTALVFDTELFDREFNEDFNPSELGDTVIPDPSTRIQTPNPRIPLSITIRETKTAELVRKLSLIPTYFLLGDPKDVSPAEVDLLVKQEPQDLPLDTAIAKLPLYDFCLEINAVGDDLTRAFAANPLLPGIIVTEQNRYVTMISRRHFVEQMSRPFALELFSQRSLATFCEYLGFEPLCLNSCEIVVQAAQICLRRPVDTIYEPVVVFSTETQAHCLLDVHDLLLAQASIHKLATKMLQDQMQARMVQTEKMASLGEMVAEVSHDIKNPVNFIHGNLDYLSTYTSALIELVQAFQSDYPTPSLKIEHLKERLNLDYILQDLPNVITSITFGAEQLRKLVDGLQTFSHVDRELPSAVDICECIDNSVLILHNRLVKANVLLEKDYGIVPPVLGFAGQLTQVFMNILSNALDALMGIGIEFSAVKQPQIKITVQRSLETVEVLISDNGSGIPLEIQARIFEAFFTTKEAGKGTGLGLAICYQIINQKHQGKINLRSPCNLDGGTEFQILFPIANLLN
jgi:two-component system, NtrC family, sensor kinase